MKVLIVRPFPSMLDVRQNTYNIQEIGLAKALNRRGCQTDLLFWTDGEEAESPSLSRAAHRCGSFTGRHSAN